jgi:hypothetical protein
VKTHDQLVEQLMSRPGVRAGVERIEQEEIELLDQLLKTRPDAGLTQASAVARLERFLVTGKHSGLHEI